MNKKLIIPIFIPHMGCPHTCVFCNQKKIAGLYAEPTPEKVYGTVREYLNSYKDLTNTLIEIAFYGGSFTGIAKELQENLLGAAHQLKLNKVIHAIRMSTRPDYINSVIITRLKKYNVDTVELGVQSLEADVLDKSERGHTEGQVTQAVELLKNAEITVGIQLMPGLPEDTEEKVLLTTQKVICLQPDFVRIYPTVIVKETKLAWMYENEEYHPWSLEKAIEVSAKMYILFAKAKIPIIRMGLQATENLVAGKDLIAGPYHPAFGELVQARVFRKQLEYLLQTQIIFPHNTDLSIYCHPQDVSQVKGQGKTNIFYYKDKYQINLQIVPLASLTTRGDLAWKNSNNTPCLVFTRREFVDKYRIEIKPFI